MVRCPVFVGVTCSSEVLRLQDPTLNTTRPARPRKHEQLLGGSSMLEPRPPGLIDASFDNIS